MDHRENLAAPLCPASSSSRLANCLSSHSRASAAALRQAGFCLPRRGKRALRSMVAIDRNSRKLFACAGKRPALRAFSNVPYVCNTWAAPAAPPLFGRGRGGKKVVGLISGCLGICKTTGGDELGQCIKLLEQFVVEFAAALIGGELLVTVGRRVHRVPTYQYGARLLRPVELQQEIREAKDRTGRPAPASQNRLG